MQTFSHALARTLAFLAVANLAGCDDPELPLIDDDVELRLYLGPGDPPDPSIIEIVKRPPLYPVELIDKGYGIPWNSPWIHSGYDPSSGAVIDPTGYAVYTFDQNDLLPFGTSDVGDFKTVCDDFKLEHDTVPIAETGDLSHCAAEEQGCCDFICKEWGAVAPAQNRVAFVDQEVMDIDPIMKSYVPEFLEWDSEDPNHNGGLGRGKACACNCVTP